MLSLLLVQRLSLLLLQLLINLLLLINNPFTLFNFIIANKLFNVMIDADDDDDDRLLLLFGDDDDSLFANCAYFDCNFCYSLCSCYGFWWVDCLLLDCCYCFCCFCYRYCCYYPHPLLTNNSYTAKHKNSII